MKRFGIESLYYVSTYHFTGERKEFDDFGTAASINNLCKKYGIDCSNMTQAFFKSKRLEQSRRECYFSSFGSIYIFLYSSNFSSEISTIEQISLSEN